MILQTLETTQDVKKDLIGFNADYEICDAEWSRRLTNNIMTIQHKI